MAKGIDAKDGAELREKWDGSPCDHAGLLKEYVRGSSTGDYVCARCGAVGWGKDWADEEREKNSNRQ